MTSSGMPLPVSITDNETYCPDGRSFLGSAIVEPPVGSLKH
jgi:hypothetical protein